MSVHEHYWLVAFTKIMSSYTLVEYIWLDAWQRSRSKTKVVHGKSSVTLDDLGDWNYDGSSTGKNVCFVRRLVSRLTL